MPRKLPAMEQLRDRERWKRKHGYGQRARVESAISSFKRTFGEHMSSVKWENMVKELLLKASVYNLFVGMNPWRTRHHDEREVALVKLFDTPLTD